MRAKQPVGIGLGDSVESIIENKRRDSMEASIVIMPVQLILPQGIDVKGCINCSWWGIDRSLPSSVGIGTSSSVRIRITGVIGVC